MFFEFFKVAGALELGCKKSLLGTVLLILTYSKFHQHKQNQREKKSSWGSSRSVTANKNTKSCDANECIISNPFLGAHSSLHPYPSILTISLAVAGSIGLTVGSSEMKSLHSLDLCKVVGVGHEPCDRSTGNVQRLQCFSLKLPQLRDQVWRRNDS